MVDGIQGRPGAFGRMDGAAGQMMLENGRTIGELNTRFPRFTKNEAGRISCKTLVLNGEQSPRWLRKIGELLASSISGSEYAAIPGAAHFPHVERPAEFNVRVLGFLSSS
jgi:pimeloyl-ACP methyl ester carboxylesterase